MVSVIDSTDTSIDTSNSTKPEWLLTPGPLTTATPVRAAMMRDWGSWDSEFRALTAEVRHRLLLIAGNQNNDFDCVPMQGSGTFVCEAMLGSFVPRDGKVLVLINGAYGHRIASTLKYLNRDYVVIDKGDYLPPRAHEVSRVLENDPAITHVVVVHCETSSGILNPVEEISEAVYARGCKLLIDSMSAFGALPLDTAKIQYEAMVSSANKCIEGVPGFGFVIARKSAIVAAKGVSHSLALDIHAQWETMEKTGQWRFTPPTHCVAAFVEALTLHEAQGGAPARLARYQKNCNALVSGMRAAGFETLLSEPWLSPVIVTFFNPQHPQFRFEEFYRRLKQRGFIIYPGKLTVVDSFRMGCIGDFDHQVMSQAAKAAADALQDMGVTSAAPSAQALAEKTRLAS